MTQWQNPGARWWFGLTDMLANGVCHGAQKLERIHLSVADETFNLLDRVPLTRPWSRLVRTSHHGISRLSYGSVSLAALTVADLNRSMSRLAYRDDGPADTDETRHPS